MLEKAGFDGIEVNASSKHLIHSFLSPFWNKRRDAYGGNLEKSFPFSGRIIHEIKKRLGRDYPVSVIINGIEMGTLIGVENSDVSPWKIICNSAYYTGCRGRRHTGTIAVARKA